MSDSIYLYLKGEILGRITDLDADMFFWHGRWHPEQSSHTEQFHHALKEAMARWEEDIAGVEAYLDPESREIVEVTSIENGVIDIHVNPALWPSYKALKEQRTANNKPAKNLKPWWQFWKL